ncbi:MAG: SpoIIE family protein phosphatase [Actinobacteria bacterium]|nr:SpoIIE family protein phosphatase [Actinomycetota bacterium]
MLVADEARERERLAAVRRYAILATPADGTFDRITQLAARLLQVPIAVVSVVDEDRIWFKSHHGLETSEMPRSPGLCASAILHGEPYVLPDARLDPVALTNPLVAGEFGLRFYAAVPLTVSGGHNLGTLCVIDTAPRNLDDEEMKTLSDLGSLVVHELELRLAARAAVEFEAELRQESDALSLALQAALLPPHLPSIPGLDIAARYQPAAGAQIGGDFYDVFPLPRHGWGLAMGDVCGKGARAATVTAAARYALRAAAVDHDRPSDVLSVLNEAMLMGDDHDHDDTRFCTLVYARLRPHEDYCRVTVGSGGHPLPLILRNDGTVEAVGGYGTLIGSVPDVSFVDRRTRLRSGDTLVLFTDGVTEAAVAGRLLGEHGLVRVLSSCRGQSACELVASVADTVLGDQPQRDDVAILAVRADG